MLPIPWEMPGNSREFILRTPGSEFLRFIESVLFFVAWPDEFLFSDVTLVLTVCRVSLKSESECHWCHWTNVTICGGTLPDLWPTRHSHYHWPDILHLTNYKHGQCKGIWAKWVCVIDICSSKMFYGKDGY